MTKPCSPRRKRFRRSKRPMQDPPNTIVLDELENNYQRLRI